MSELMRIAVIGAGYWGKNLVRNFHQLGALAAIVEPDPVAQNALSESYGEVMLSGDLHQVLNDESIGAVAISTPAETHAEIIRACLLANKDVYVEKPLCLQESTGQELIELARARGRTLMVGHLLWYHPVLLKLKAMIAGGELGKIQYLYSNRLNMGKLRREENVLWSFAPHDVSVILGLLDEMPNSVSTQGGNYLQHQVADVTVSLLSFASGVKAHIFVSWLHPFKEQKLVVVGDKAMAVFDDTAPWDGKLTLFSHGIQWRGQAPIAVKADGVAIGVEQEEPLRAECAHFLHCIKTRQTPRTDGVEGLRVLKVLNACQRSLESGAVERLDSIMLNPEVRDYFVHSTSVVEEDAVIGAGTKIWHFSHILGQTRIGANCNIGQNVVIGPKVRIGAGCKIQNNVSIYEGVELEDQVFCGPSMVFTNVHNPRCEVRRMDEIRSTRVQHGASLGANCTIVCGVQIGRYAFVGAGAVVLRDVPDYALVVGNPARQIGWMSRHGGRLDLPLSGNGEAECSATGERYAVSEGICVLKDDANV
jgi:UDP-2-acetamido-3-amino-2,3-dideoxy-glucuronate N-acetyltransferase